MNETAEPRATCPTPLRMFNAEGNVVAVACDRWGCDACRQVLSYRWAIRVRYGMALHGGTCYHWTLTLPGKIKTGTFAFMVLPGMWDNLRKNMQRERKKWDYAAFVEIHPHRVGIAHFHVITFEASTERIKDRAVHAGFGYMATEQLIEGWEAARYVSKYTSKQGSQMPKGFRRVRLSQKWPKLPEAAYDIPLLPMRAKESLGDYLVRVSKVSEQPIIDLLARWQHKGLDL